MMLAQAQLLPKVAALLSMIVAGTVSAGGFLSTVRLNDSVASAARLATLLPHRLSSVTHPVAPFGRRAISLVLHIALAPAHFTLSLVAAVFHMAFETLTGVIQLVQLFLSHLM